MKHPAWKRHAAKALREQGMLQRQIADELEVPLATISFWLDPRASEKAKDRKKRYGGTCQTCGAPTDGSNGRGKAPTKCRSCAAQESKQRRHWTPERITASIIQFHYETGRAPRAADFRKGRLDYMPPLSAVYGPRQPPVADAQRRHRSSRTQPRTTRQI